jgi:1,4-dihydroxy-2-naphthoate octaprenyltransferase
MKGLIIAARPLYLPGSVLLYALGVVTATGPGAVGSLAAGLVIVVLAHLITHFVNDAEDVATDDRTTAATAFTGGSRAIQRGLVTARGLRRAAAALALAAGAVVIFEAASGDVTAAAIHLAIVVLGYSYSGRPLTFGRRGLGEVVTATVMGVLMPLAGAHAGGGPSPAFAGLAALLFAETVFARLCTAHPDVDADRATGKWTLPALLGTRRSALAFGVVAVAIAATGLGAAPLLPSPQWQRLRALGVACVAAGVAAWVASGRAQRWPVLVPAAGLLACGTSVLVLLATYVT